MTDVSFHVGLAALLVAGLILVGRAVCSMTAWRPVLRYRGVRVSKALQHGLTAVSWIGFSTWSVGTGDRLGITLCALPIVIFVMAVCYAYPDVVRRVISRLLVRLGRAPRQRGVEITRVVTYTASVNAGPTKVMSWPVQLVCGVTVQFTAPVYSVPREADDG